VIELDSITVKEADIEAFTITTEYFPEPIKVNNFGALFTQLVGGATTRTVHALFQLPNCLEYADRFPLGQTMLMIIHLNTGNDLVIRGSPYFVAISNYKHSPPKMEFKLTVDAINIEKSHT